MHNAICGCAECQQRRLNPATIGGPPDPAPDPAADPAAHEQPRNADGTFAASRDVEAGVRAEVMSGSVADYPVPSALTPRGVDQAVHNEMERRYPIIHGGTAIAEGGAVDAMRSEVRELVRARADDAQGIDRIGSLCDARNAAAGLRFDAIERRLDKLELTPGSMAPTTPAQ